jgi:alpha-beta hydrolase superfamily lysophospholipase
VLSYSINIRNFQKNLESEMAHEDADLSFLDRPEILEIVFYPRTSNIKPLAPNAKNHFIEVEKGIKIGCRYHTIGKDYPSLLYFHGNATIVDDLDLFAPLFNDIGINLFVAGYRGYGLSNGTPTVTNMIKDSHRVFEEFKKTVEDYSFRKSFFVMGRSLGSFSAIELAYNYQDDLQGLIVESGPSNNLKQYISSMVPLDHPIWRDDSTFLNKVKLRSISKPTLIIHGEQDSLIPVDEGKEMYENSAAKDKRLVIIPNADHGDLFIVGKEQYYKAIREFVEDYS